MIDYRDKKAVERLFSDYRAAVDNGNNTLAEELYRQIHEVNRAKANDKYNAGNMRIERIKKKNAIAYARKEFKRNRKIAAKEGCKTLNMSDFADRLAGLGDEQDITVDGMWAHYRNSKKKLVFAALEFAAKLGVVNKVGDKTYRRSGNISEGKMRILKNASTDGLSSRLEGFNLRKEKKSSDVNSITTSVYNYDSDAMRLNLSSNAYESGHGRKKKEEWNEKAALDASRERYGLNKKDILQYDLD